MNKEGTGRHGRRGDAVICLRVAVSPSRPSSFFHPSAFEEVVDAHLLAIYYPIQHWKGGDSKIYEF